MKNITNFRLEEADRLVKWILDNPGKWSQVIDRDDMCTKEHLIEILKILKKAELYQVIIVLIALNQEDDERRLCAEEIEQVWREFIADKWNKETLLYIMDEIIKKLENQ